MRFNDLQAFFSHLKNLVDKKCNLHLALIPDDYERSQVIQYLKRLFLKEGIECVKLEALDTSYKEIAQEATSISLFSKTSVIVIDNIHKIKDLAKFTNFAESFKDAFFLLGAPAIKGIEQLEQKIAKGGIVLNLSKEKPWERNARIEKMLFLKAKKQNVSLTPQAHKRLIEKLGHDLALLDQELRKLILFTYETKKIEVEDVEKIVEKTAEISSWQMAEELVFEKKYPRYLDIDTNTINQFINALRHQLQIGFKMASHMKEQLSYAELKEHFPKLWPKQFEKKKSQVQNLSLSYFQGGLSNLYEMELSLRDSKNPLNANLDLFISKLCHE